MTLYAASLPFLVSSMVKTLTQVGPLQRGLLIDEVVHKFSGHVGLEGRVPKGSGSERLDGASCDWAKGHWRLLERCPSHRPQPQVKLYQCRKFGRCPDLSVNLRRSTNRRHNLACATARVIDRTLRTSVFLQ